MDEAVKTLLDLKSKYKTLTGEDYKPVAASGATGGEDKNRKEKENKSEKQGGGGGKKGKGDKAGQGKESLGGAGGSGEGQGSKKQTRWDTVETRKERSRPRRSLEPDLRIWVKMVILITINTMAIVVKILRNKVFFYFLHLK